MKQPGPASDSASYRSKPIIFAVLLCGTALLFFSCAGDIEKIKAFSSSENLPVLHAEDFETTFSDSGIMRFYLKTPELKRFETDGQAYTEFPKGILLIKFDNYGQVISTITSRYARQFTREKKWEARNDVVATNNAGDTLRTEHLTWDEQAGKIFSNDFVRIVRPDQNITGIGFEADQNMRNWRIRNPKGPIYVQINREGTSQKDSVSGNFFPIGPVNPGNE